MELKYKDMIKALNAVEEERKIPSEVIVEALKEAMAKAYKKDAELADIDVVAELNPKRETIDLYQNYVVTDNVEDDELEISLEDAREIKPDAVLGDKVSRKIEITGMSRAAATLAKNVMRQKIREAEKVAVYDEYIGQLHEMVLGIVESVKEKFTLVNLGRTVAMMPHSAGIPGERLTEGQKLRVVITEVSKETKGSQVLVSRADPTLVKRLFEKEVPEIFQGIVEIKAIAREAGERTKMAVMSHNPDVDPIGACIGPRGSRVQVIIDELHGEKIDIFQWNDDLTELVKNALAPAEIEAVLPGEDERSLLVIVSADQLSLAIGKRGKNARLAVKLTNHKIDIKTREELEDMGLDYDELVVAAEARKEQMRKEAARREIERMEAEAREAEERRQAALEKLQNRTGIVEDEDELIPEEMQEVVRDRVNDEYAMKPEETEEEKTEAPVQAEEPAAEPVSEPEPEEEAVTEPEEEPEETEEPEEEPEETVVEKQASKKHADVEDMAAKNTYVSVFEKLASTSKPKQNDFKSKKKKSRKSDEEDFKVNNKELEERLRKSQTIIDNRPVYTDEELDEIEAQRLEEEEREYDIDYDEYEEYYDEDDN
ncbi:MAG: transcription termination/antitermination protein NusA [Solobacterium sp.]|nr:transcription termination/antitermination protein NusA [Solobacterium sp.]